MDAPKRRGAFVDSQSAHERGTEVHALKALAARRQDDEQGFTLIELMVVVLITVMFGSTSDLVRAHAFATTD